ncbi:hypothetical protein U9M48_002673 [Paspalum notatum var. saurae]|uniref:Uncharacterized protein n=1 Tax=Paspalum notatum var. saurae TaxID=547442 RepID=A0AAQ3PK74_PASNO
MARSASCRGGASCSGKPLPVGASTVGSSPPILAPPPPGSAPPRRSAAALRVPGSAASRCDTTHQQLVALSHAIKSIKVLLRCPSPFRLFSGIHASKTAFIIFVGQLIVGGLTFGNVAIANQTFVM